VPARWPKRRGARRPRAPHLFPERHARTSSLPTIGTALSQVSAACGECIASQARAARAAGEDLSVEETLDLALASEPVSSGTSSSL
jgi:hypothetical protein